MALKSSLLEIIRHLECVAPVWKEALEQVQSKLKAVKTNPVHCDGLAKAYQAGIGRIVTLVHMVLDLLQALSGSQLKGVERSLLLFLWALAEIERCMHSGALYTSTGDILEVLPSKLLDLDGNRSVISKLTFFLVREFSFRLDMVQVAFIKIVFELKELDISKFRSAEEFCNSQPVDLFEWYEKKHRLVLKKRFLRLGQKLVRHLFVDKGMKANELFEVKLSPWISHILDEVGAKSENSRPVRITYDDVQQGKLLGQGSYGSVLQCKLQDKGMVMKIIKLDPTEPRIQENFEREVSILSSFKHPAVLRCFGYGLAENKRQGCILMERMEMDLFTLIQDVKKDIATSPRPEPVLPLDTTFDMLSQIVEGMCALRFGRVMHRDLTPGNILVNRLDKGMGPSEHVYQMKIADFGASKSRDVSSSIFNTLKVGTVAYMAPEVLEAAETGSRGYSWKADVYSLGVVFSEIISGERPFSHLSLVTCKNVLAAVRRGDMPMLPLAVEDPLRRLIEDCWGFKPDARPDVYEVRQRLWQCRVRHFFEMKRAPTSWEAFCTRLVQIPVSNNIGGQISSEAASTSSSSRIKSGDQAAESRRTLEMLTAPVHLMRHWVSLADIWKDPADLKLFNSESASLEFPGLPTYYHRRTIFFTVVSCLYFEIGTWYCVVLLCLYFFTGLFTGSFKGLLKGSFRGFFQGWDEIADVSWPI